MKQESKSFGGDVYTFKTQDETLDETRNFSPKILQEIPQDDVFLQDETNLQSV